MDEFDTHTSALRKLGGRRVWSLMISLFGDLAQGPGQTIDGPVLSAIMAGLHIKPEATRVALHRLRNDGWLVSEKSGRISRHSLTAKGRAESAAASPRIYAAPYGSGGAWQLVITETPQDDDMARRGFAPITDRVFVGPVHAAAPEDALRFPGDDVPDWLRHAAQPDHLSQGYAELHHTLAALQDDLPPVSALSAVETAILRCLIVHNWRRLVLKHPLLPAPLVRDDWPGHRCHLIVDALLSDYPRPDLRDIAQDRAAA